jgi:hypothetical protein
VAQEHSYGQKIHQFIYDQDKTPNELNQQIDEFLKIAPFHPDWFEGLVKEMHLHFVRFLRANGNQNNDAYRTWNLKWKLLAEALLKFKREVIEIYIGKYLDAFYEGQTAIGGFLGKGLPFALLASYYLQFGAPAQKSERAQVYFFLAMIEDMISNLGGGEDWRTKPAWYVLQNVFRVPEAGVVTILDAVKGELDQGKQILYPEDILLDWLISAKHGSLNRIGCPFIFNRIYANYLVEEVKSGGKGTADSKGKTLERLGGYLFLTTHIFEVVHRKGTKDSDIDLFVRNRITDDPIFEEFGRYLLVECKNLDTKVDSGAIKKFAFDTIAASCSCGVLISKEGVSGEKDDIEIRDSIKAILVSAYKHGTLIIRLSLEDLHPVIRGEEDFRELLLKKYEEVRFGFK